MENPITRLKNQIFELTNAQRQVADYILKNPSEVAFYTMEQLARQVGTSTTTVIRMATNLGYSGYSDFQKGLQMVLKEQTAPNARLESNLKNIEKDDLWGNTIKHYTEQIQATMDHIPKEQLDEVVTKIATARKIYCTSVRSGLPISQYLTHGLNRILGNCTLVSADTSDWIDEVISMQPNDLIIATSFPRYAKRIIDLVSIAKEQNVQIIAITDNYSAPIIEYADIILPCDPNSLAFHNSPIVAMVVADYLISATTIQLSSSTKDRLDKVNKILTNINYHQ